MPRIKLVLSDMDGTLVPLGTDGVSQRTLDAIVALHDAGIEFGPSSGRERSDLVRFFRGDERCIETGIMGSGKLVYLDGELVLRRPLPREQLELLVDVVRGMRGVMVNVYRPLDASENGLPGFLALGVNEDERELLGEMLDGPVLDALPEGQITTGAVLMATQAADPAEVHRTLVAACPGLDFPMPVPFCFDILEKGWSKVSSLPILLDHLGLAAGEVAYFGDSQNDLTMMEALPNSFCMGNGSPEAKAAARWVIDTCEHDGAAKVMESLARNGGELIEADWS